MGIKNINQTLLGTTMASLQLLFAAILVIIGSNSSLFSLDLSGIIPLR